MHVHRSITLCCWTLLASASTIVSAQTALNSEWKNYRWEPVAGSAAVPSLVDENGFFFSSKNRQGELVVVVTYRDVIAKDGLKSMRRPVG